MIEYGLASGIAFAIMGGGGFVRAGRFPIPVIAGAFFLI